MLENIPEMALEGKILTMFIAGQYEQKTGYDSQHILYELPEW